MLQVNWEALQMPMHPAATLLRLHIVAFQGFSHDRYTAMMQRLCSYIQLSFSAASAP